MNLQLVPTEILLSTDHWISVEELAEQPISPEIGAALQNDGLLTTALQNAYGLPSSVDCRNQSNWVDEESNTGLRRDVLIKTGETVRVTAATLMPHQIISHYPWLTTMGNNPLGEMLEKHDQYRRGDFEYRQLDAELIFPSPPSSALLLWARRYRFFLANSFLLVTEVFLPGVLECLGKAL